MLKVYDECVISWEIADPGQWFIGVFAVDQLSLAIVPVNVFEGSGGALKKGVLENDDSRAMNRYASGAPGERDGLSLMPHWLAHRKVGQTHHSAVATHFGYNDTDVWGFSAIKLAPGFALVKTSSTSLNSSKGGEVKHSFSRQTAEAGRTQRQMNREHAGSLMRFFTKPDTAPKLGFTAGSHQMTEGAREHLKTALINSPLDIRHVAMSWD